MAAGASGAVSGFAGAMVTTSINAYASGKDIGESLYAGAVDGLTGAVLGGATGFLGGYAARGLIVSIIGQGRCAPWKLAVSEVIQDTVSGAIEGGVEGGVSGFNATGSVWGALEGARTGAAFGALMGGGMSSVGNIAGLMKSCFSAGTPLLTPDGSKPIEAFRPGDLVLSRDENLLGGPIEPKTVEEIFVRMARIMQLVVRGVTIETTAEHPFWVLGKGWLPAGELAAGDLLTTHTGEWVRVDAVDPTEVWGQVYNLRVADFHTYFVGCEAWGFSVWAHNAVCTPEQLSMLEAEATRLGLPMNEQTVAKLQVMADDDPAYLQAYAKWGQQMNEFVAANGVQEAAAIARFGPEPARPAMAAAAEAWLADRSLQVLYRGQGPLAPGQDFVSDIARGQAKFRSEPASLATSRLMVAEMEAVGLDPYELRAMWHTARVPAPGSPLHGQPIGAAGIPFSSRIPVSAGFAQQPGGVVYATLQQVGQARLAKGWNYFWEYEHVALHEVSHSSIIHTLPGPGLPLINPPS